MRKEKREDDEEKIRCRRFIVKYNRYAIKWLKSYKKI